MPNARDKELSGTKRIEEKLRKVYSTVDKGFTDQNNRADSQIDYWDCYNNKLNEHQYYNGNSQIYVPIIHTAINARRTRFVNQLFPKTGRYVDVTTADGEIPHAECALLENYVDKSKLRTEVAPALSVNGDIEGQYNVYVGWSSIARHVTSRIKKGVEVDGVEMPEVDEMDDIETEILFDDHPVVEVLNDSDVLVLPATANSVEEALAFGGSATIVRRWSKGQIEKMIEDKEFTSEAGEPLLDAMRKESKLQKQNVRKHNLTNAGIRDSGKFCVGFETWTMLKVDGTQRLVRVYYGGDNVILGCKLNPYWCDLCPLISVPVKKVSGNFKGVSMVEPVATLQYSANDIVNQGADSATYSMLPIIMTDPEKNPRMGTMILDLAAVWQTSPKDTQFAKFPEIWQSAFQFVASAKQQIEQTLGVNPAMIPQSSGSKNTKRNQAEIANEQMVDVLTTADSVTILEEGVFTPVMQRFAWYDHQFRNDEVTIRAFGRMGMRAKMEKIPPLQMGNNYYFRWFGVEQARNAAAIQQQISGINVLRGIPPQMYPGRQLDLTPVIEAMVENTFGPRLAPLIFKDMQSQLSVEPEMENQMMQEGFDMPVSPMDDDQKHVQAHLPALQMGDDSGNLRVHILKHQAQMAAKAQSAQAGSPNGQPGTPGGAGPGTAGVPRPGAQAAGPNAGKGPPGQIPPESMASAGAVTMPRKY